MAASNSVFRNLSTTAEHAALQKAPLRARRHWPRGAAVAVIPGCASIGGVDDATFWSLIERLDWTQTGDDDRVVEPVVHTLAQSSADEVQAFQDRLAEKLHALDGRAWARASGPGIWWGEPDSLSVDGFLYARCVVVANGRRFYENVLANPSAMPEDMEFEALLYVAAKARERQGGEGDQPDTAVSYETFSNKALWD
jgi:hypothetical protein